MFHDEIRSEFPFMEVKSEPNISIDIKNQEGKIETSYNPTAWYFHKDNDEIKSPMIIEITDEYALLDFNTGIESYSGFNNFRKYIILLIGALSVFNIKKITSVGLRYINTINCNDGNPIEWSGLINDNLVFDSLLNHYDSPSRLMSQFIFEKNDFGINFNFGIFNTEFPNPIARKEFILAFDCIYPEEIVISEVFDIIDDMHDTISELFEENITDKFREYIR